jgi:hypothetical protein
VEYLNRFIRDETRGVDLYIRIISIDGSALEVACPPPRRELERKFEKVLFAENAKVVLMKAEEQTYI